MQEAEIKARRTRDMITMSTGFVTKMTLKKFTAEPIWSATNDTNTSDPASRLPRSQSIMDFTWMSLDPRRTSDCSVLFVPMRGTPERSVPLVHMLGMPWYAGDLEGVCTEVSDW